MKMPEYFAGNEHVTESVISRETVWPQELARHGFYALPTDQPLRWPVKVRTGLVLLAAGLGGPDAGIALLSAFHPRESGDASLTEQDIWARLTLAKGDAVGAVTLSRARQIMKDSAPAHLVTFDALLALDRREAALIELETMRGLANERSVAPLIAEGHIALLDQDWSEAEEHFRSALAILPSAPAVRGLAQALIGGGLVEEAAVVLADGARVAAGETAPELWEQLAVLRESQGDLTAAASARAERLAGLEALATRLRTGLAQLRESGGSRAAPRTPGPIDRPPPPVHMLDTKWLPGDPSTLDDTAPELERTLFEHFGHTQFRPGQAAVLRSVLLDETDTLAVMPTGAGKSLCFQLPALLDRGLVLVVSPLIALMADQLAGLDAVPALAEQATSLSSAVEGAELDRRLALLAAGKLRLLYCAPERLRQASLLRALRKAGVSLLVVDEAHCLSIWGHQFRPDYLAVGEAAHALGSPRILAVTATATPAMQEEIARTLERPLRLVRTGVLRENVFLEVRRLADEAEKRQTLLAFARAAKGSGIVYAGSREKCEQLANLLRRNGVQAAYYHAGMDATARTSTQQQFMAGRIRVLVATIAFGMGVNKRDIRFIVHYQPSRSLEAYVQEAGRAGRDGAPAHALLLGTPGDKATMRRFMRDDLLTMDQLRGVFARARSAIRVAAGGPIDLSVLDDPTEDARRGDVASRVSLSILARAGYLTRGLDCPRSFTLQAGTATLGSADPRLTTLVERHGLDEGLPVSLPVQTLAQTLGVAVDEVEEILLDWSDAGLLHCKVGKRGAFLTLVEPPPRDGAAALASILAAQERANEERIDAMARYIEAPGCRNAVIARHFGETTPSGEVIRCGRCDRCAPAGRRTGEVAKREDGPRREWDGPALTASDAVLTLVASLPFAAGRTGLAKILHGASDTSIGPDRCALHGYLVKMPVKSIVSEIDALLDEGLLSAVRADKYPTVALTQLGRDRIA
jgi:ATP-dependent DNA helicase RecQ